MATSGTVSATTFNTLRVIDTAFRRCKIMAQNITPEMHDYAKNALYLFLSSLANGKCPSWCIEKIILPMYEGQPVVTLPQGTVDIQSCNYRTVQYVEGTTQQVGNAVTVQFAQATSVSTVGLKWSGASSDVLFEVSDDGSTWVTVGSESAVVDAGEWVWTDIIPARSAVFFRATSTGTLSISQIVTANTPSEIPLGRLSLDQYAVQNNKTFPSRPTTFWFQRDLPQPVLNLWPAPYAAAELAQIVCYRQRHIMDVGTLRQEIEVPQRWLEAIIANLAAMVGAETPQVDATLVAQLEAKATVRLKEARDGDNNGSSLFFQPNIGLYTGR